MSELGNEIKIDWFETKIHGKLAQKYVAYVPE